MAGSILRKKTFAALAAALLAAWAAPSGASTFASFSVGPISFNLFDLNPDDGIAPSISFLGTGSLQEVATARDYGLALFDSQNVTVSPWVPLAVSAAVPGSWVSVSVSGNDGGTVSGTTLKATGATHGTGSQPGAGEIYGRIATDYSFTLSPFTKVVFEADVSLSASTTHGGAAFEFANLRSWLRTWDENQPPGAAPQSSLDEASIYVKSAWNGSQYVPDSGSLGDTLSVSFVNGSASALDGKLRGNFEMTGYSPAPVPEPETWALLLAGLGIVGGIARRRRERQA